MAPQGPIVEIGSWKGRSTICLAGAALDAGGGAVYAIDPFTGSEEHRSDGERVWTFDQFLRNINSAGVSNIITPIVAYSHDALPRVPGFIAMIFIDGAHDYENVRQDYTDWLPKLMPGGMVAFHDATNWPGVKRLVHEEIYGKLARLGHAGTVIYASKQKPSVLDRSLRGKWIDVVTEVRVLQWKIGRHLPLPRWARDALRRRHSASA
jgi:predicted O-methyltransferase YrrM